MRWDNLFDDLESQLELELGAQDTDLRAEQERLRLGRLSLRDRLMSMVSAREAGNAQETRGIRILLTSGETVAVVPSVFGKDWLAAELVEESHRRSQCVLALGAISAILPTTAQLSDSFSETGPTPGVGRVIDRIGLPFVLRDLCRRRASVELATGSGRVYGTIDRVGRDHVDVAVHEPGSLRREANVSHYRIVPAAHILYVRL